MQVTHSVQKGHGPLEERWLEATERLKLYLDWPGVHQVCRIHRRRVLRGEESWETVYAITSLSRQEGDAERLLTLCRGHWGIENRPHCGRHTTLAEDACRVRTAPVAHTLAVLPNTALTLLRHQGFSNIVQGLEHFAEHRSLTIRLLRYGRTK